MTIYDEHIEMVPPEYERSFVASEIIRVLSLEHERLEEAHQDILDQFFVQTATWGLNLWEEQLGLPVEPGSDIHQDVFEAFSTDGIATGEWANDSLVPTISGGSLNFPMATGNYRTYYTQETYEHHVHLTAKVTLDGVGANVNTGLMFRNDISNYVMARVIASTPDKLQIVRQDGTELAAINLTSDLAAGVPHWIQFERTGNVLIARYWTTDPALGGSPDKTISHTLQSPNLATFGDGVELEVGFFANNQNTTVTHADAFVATSEEQTPLDTPTRRAIILARLQGRRAASRKSFADAILAVAPGSRIVYDYTNSNIIVKIGSFNTTIESTIENLLDKITPAHLDSNAQFGSFIAGLSNAGDTV